MKVHSQPARVTTAAKSAPSLAPPSRNPAQRLQRVLGNNGIQQLFASTGNGFGTPVDALRSLGIPLQPKLEIGPASDPLEQEADRVAESVMRMPEGSQVLPQGSDASPLVRRKCACGSSHEEGECEECKKLRENSVQRSAEPSAPAGLAPPIVHEVLRYPGQPLDAVTRAFMEPRLGHDFSGVRVHTSAKATESADAIHALAYTVGPDVIFGAGRYQPHTGEGRRLLAHELSHTIQQGGAPGQGNQPLPMGGGLLRARSAETPFISRKDGGTGGPSHRANDPNQLKSELHPTGKALLFADQVASIYFPTKIYVPDQDDLNVLKALAQEYQYTAQRHGGLRGKIIGHADIEASSDPDNQELSFQRARWTAAVFKSYVAAAANVPEANLEFETEGAGTGFCMGDPKCREGLQPDALARYRRADVMIFTEKMPSPPSVSCPPPSGAGVKTLSEYIELVRCAEAKTGFNPRTMLALLRQMYYGKPWSATTSNPLWNFVIPCSPDLGNPKDKLGQPLFDALHSTVTIEGTDLGHVFTGLESMTCPSSSVTIEKAKLGVGVELTVDISNESFATWGGDVGSAAAAFVACLMMTDQERATKGKDECAQGKAFESLEEYFVKRQAPPEDLEGDIAPFVIRAAERGGCGGSLEKAFTPQEPISTLLTKFFYNRGPTGMTSRDRYQCFAEAIGATVVNGKITNRVALIKKYEHGVFSFAWAYYVFLKKEIPRSDPIVPLLDRNSTAALILFFDWLEARMQK